MNTKYLSWLAGFIDGEGCFFSRQRNGGGADFWVLIKQHHLRGKNILLEVKSNLGIGNINKAGETGWQFVISKRQDVKQFCKIILPLLRVKHLECERFLQMIDEWEEKRMLPQKGWRLICQ